ncbi:MAG TPA: hypothetical protein VK659_05575 [Asanoa sp.]|nr:hypothetical protein [Asanoa sp.]
MRATAVPLLLLLLVSACGQGQPGPTIVAGQSSAPGASASASAGAQPTPGKDGIGRGPTPKPPAKPASFGNPGGKAAIPAEARAENTSKPSRKIGTGTKASCTSDAVVKAVAAGGVITFNCGPDPVTITMTATAKIKNANGPKIVLDGGGRVTLSGGGKRRILYMNTCDEAQGFLTSHCQDQDSPRLTVQNLTFTGGNSTGDKTEGGGGGAVFVRGGRFKAVNTKFVDNRCDASGPDLGGAAIRVLSQFHGEPVYIVGSTFQGGVCSNGAALSSIGVSWVVLNSVFRNNKAIGSGANPARSGSPGGGSGGAIYLDGNLFTLRIAGSVVQDNTAKEGGGGVFFVSNDRTGTMRVENTTWKGNRSSGFETSGFPGIFFLGARPPTVTGPSLKR